MHSRPTLTEDERETLEFKINSDGLEYAIENYADVVGSDCKAFHSRVHLYLEHRDALVEFLEENGVDLEG